MSEFVSTKKAPFLSAQMIAKVAVLGAFAFLVMMFEVPIPFFVSFYKLGFDEVVVMIGGFALGPLAAVMIEAIKILLNLLVNSTVTAGVGELSNFLVGCAYVILAAIYYQRHKDKQHAWLALGIGTLCMTIAGTLINYFFILPMYSAMLPLPMDDLIAAGTALNGNIDSLFMFVLLMTAPFNFVKATLSSLIVALSYKRVSGLLKR